ncbi:geranylgeranyltransferase I beta subunit Cwg2 [Schizosaccharomyces cryophilus OY26]|uniref:Geranylgeranyltransferase I beta subunit Cwg2 n=1 Tax=Schizosaccharomyces cryophilus (strain OY26 / ATCC MYA-4695 / CBS 11777 / NBRC 106824 / NRRL Y48691) TaxID=653667 RepID=S9W0U7_SCHCR|nr:geranylgeranyltransferase I beta subunit Cwg2 [Schizosaccharomyces cryophilus OY26]EPY52049.1 geranylgeranyltransferase I beta subunit Cwg2 [Schizosaccharomyces cryophilus OY26]
MQLTVSKHVAFFQRHLILLPNPYEEHDSERMALGFFCLLGLDLLNSLDKVSKEDRESWIEWIYRNYILMNCEDSNCKYAGFRGFATGGTSLTVEQEPQLAATSFAISNLLLLGDDLSRIDKHAVEQFLSLCQLPGGHFKSTASSTCYDQDMRQLYLATTIATLLDISFPHIELSFQYILHCQNYEGGFSLIPFAEAHAGATFCALASLRLLVNIISIQKQPKLATLDNDSIPKHYALQDYIPDTKKLITWLVKRQQISGGFNGRTNKDHDTCYSYWVQGSLQLLGASQFISHNNVKSFLLNQTQHNFGGFSKVAGEFPDVLHSSLGLYALAFNDETNFPKVEHAICLPTRRMPNYS